MTAPSDIKVFDRTRLRGLRRRTAARLNDHSFLIDWAETQICDRLQDIKRNFETTLHIGHPPLSKATKNRGGYTPHSSQELELCKINKSGAEHFFVMDEECLPLADNSLDLIISNLNLHSVNDLPGALIQMRRALKPDGLFLAAMFGGETLYQLRESLMQTEIAMHGGVSPRVFPFADKQQMGALLQRAGFALPVVDSEIVTVTYETIFDLMHDLRGMGESNIIRARNRRYPGREFFSQAGEYYRQNFSDSAGRLETGFEVIFLLGWAPHESQQKPLKPGSAQTKLADALQTEEIKTGEHARP